MKHVHIFPDKEILINNLVQKISDLIKNTIRLKGGFTFSLSGGSTPGILYRRLSEEKYIDWGKVYFFWSDERYLAHENPESNYYLAKKYLFDNLKMPKVNIFPIYTNVTPEESAQKYENTLKKFFKSDIPLFDLSLLGIGEDGHTASLFPGFEQLNNTHNLVISVYNSPKSPDVRITLTYKAINSSQNIFVLATGSSKTAALKNVFNKGVPVDQCPIKGIRAKMGTVEWWLDEEAGRFI